MKLIKNYLLALFLFFCYTLSYSQTIRFQSLSIKDGLSQSAINCVVQDSLGFMWIGTQDGLNRFDGVSFKTYKHVVNDSRSLSNSFITALAIDSSGMFWIGTQNGGLNKFNPKNEKINVLKSIPELENATINDLKVKGNKLYIATAKRGFFSYDLIKKDYVKFDLSSGFPTNRMSKISLVQDNLWLGTEGQGLVIFDPSNNQFTHFEKSLGRSTLYNNNTSSAHYLGNSKVLLGTYDGLAIVDISKVVPEFSKLKYSSDDFKDEISEVTSILSQDDSTIWVGTNGQGLFKLKIIGDEIELRNFHENDLNNYSVTNNSISALLKDKTGIIWIGSQDGMSYFDPLKQGFNSFSFEYGAEKTIIDKTVWSIFNNDTLTLIGTRKGVTCIDKKTDTYYQIPFKTTNLSQPNNNSIFHIQIGPKKRMWVSTASGLYILRIGNGYSSFDWEKIPYRKVSSKWDDDACYHFDFDENGNIWVGCKEGLACIDLSDLTFDFYRNNPFDKASIPGAPCRYVHINKTEIWAGFMGDGFAKVNRKIIDDSLHLSFERYVNTQTNSNSLSHNTVLSIQEEPEGILWIGTYGGGLNKFDTQTKQFAIYTEEAGLTNNSIYGMTVIPNEKSLWISTNYGISNFNLVTEKFMNFHENDGLQSNEFNAGAVFRDAQGQLFFGGINGYNSFFPSKIESNTIPPQVVLTNLLISQKPIATEIENFGNVSYYDEINLGYKQNSLTFMFSALHYTFPKGNRYKVKLEGVDEEVVFLNDMQQINYSNLKSGTYILNIWASNSDGVWTSKPKTLKINIASPFWAKWWFISILIALIALVVYVSYIFRIRSIQSQKERLAFLVEKRTKTITLQKEQMEKQKKELEIEQEKSEKLLLNILPAETVEELKNKGKARTRYYRMVTVMFTDIKGFTKIAEDYKPTELVKRLDNLFREIDKIIERHQLVKIKTIGDAYMAAAGVPLRDKENPINSVLAALEIQAYINSDAYIKKVKDPWEMRIGLHTGDVIAGVIGTSRIAYDIWGNTVNVANRMEMSGEPGKVNISGKTHDFIKPYFDCTYRGKIPAKNKGEIDMYFVDAIKPHLSENGEGILPNQKFKDYVNLHIYSSINYRKAERHIMKILKSKLSPNLHYHGIHHTFDVVEAVERLAIMEGVLDEDIFVLKSAATYHDAGFVEQYDANEPVGARMASDILPLYGYTEKQVELVHGLIYATIIPHKPETHLQQIICDADLDYLGRDDFPQISDTLRRELRDHGKINSDRLWDEIQVKFLTMHKFFTDSAIKLRQAKKLDHLEMIKQRLIEDNYKD